MVAADVALAVAAADTVEIVEIDCAETAGLTKTRPEHTSYSAAAAASSVGIEDCTDPA